MIYGGKIMKYIPLEQQVAKERQENAKLRAEILQLKGDLDYTAMMTGVDIDDSESEDEEDEAQ